MITDEEFMDIRAMRRQGMTFAEIGRIVGRDWRTVKRYIEEGAQPRYRRRRAPSRLDPLKHIVDQWLADKPELEAARIHQDLVLDYGFTGSYDIVMRYVARSRPAKVKGPEDRFETAPGHQAQVDWSYEEPITTESGLQLPMYGFHMILGHSRASFVALTGSTDLVTFWDCHRKAFDYFGGFPKEILYDRTKTVVRRHVGKERGGEKQFHPEALAFAHHYGFRLRLCRPFRPKTKGKVERDVRFVRERLLRGHGFRSHDEANRAWRRWNDKVALRRVHGTHKEVVEDRARRDLEALGSLPKTPYLVVRRAIRKVGRDGYMSFEGRPYPVPKVRRGEKVELRIGPRELEVYSNETGALVATYPRLPEPSLPLPDPTEDSVSLAKVLGNMPDPDVRSRSLSVYEEATGG